MPARVILFTVLSLHNGRGYKFIIWHSTPDDILTRGPYGQTSRSLMMPLWTPHWRISPRGGFMKIRPRCPCGSNMGEFTQLKCTKGPLVKSSWSPFPCKAYHAHMYFQVGPYGSMWAHVGQCGHVIRENASLSMWTLDFYSQTYFVQNRPIFVEISCIYFSREILPIPLYRPRTILDKNDGTK